jgi:hypothetical protein
MRNPVHALPHPLLLILGVLGIVSAGPLVSTILIGRTGLVPSLRWLGLTVAVWVVLFALAWLVADWTAGTWFPNLPEHARRALSLFAPLAVASLVLALLYASDLPYHAARTTPLRALGPIVALAVASVGAPLLRGTALFHHSPATHLATGTVDESRASLQLNSAGVLVPVFALVLMVGVNNLVFGPLGVRGAQVELWALNLALLGLSAWLLGSGWALSLVAFLALASHGQVQPALSLSFVAVPLVAVAIILAVASRAGWSNAGVLAAVGGSLAVFGLMLLPLEPSWASGVQPALCAIALAAFLRPEFWKPLSRAGRALTAVLGAGGYALASTSPLFFGRAAGELISARPALAGLPWWGMACIALALAIRAAR